MITETWVRLIMSNSMIKNTYLFFFVFFLISLTSLAQYEVLGHLIIKKNKNIGIYLYNDKYSYPASLDSNFNFSFKEIPYGCYTLKIDGNRRETSYNSIIIYDLILNQDLTLDSIKLIPASTCGCSSEILSLNKPTKGFYDSGELRWEGNYKKVLYKMFYKCRFLVFNQEKNGIWKEYYKEG